MQAIELRINTLVATGELLFSFGEGANDDMDLRRTGKGLTRHAATIMKALDELRAKESAPWAVAHDVLVQWSECLPRCMQRCKALHAYLDAWAASVYN
jgi:hypothetical protein